MFDETEFKEEDWEEEYTWPFRTVQEKLLHLSNIRIKDCEEVHKAIAGLEFLRNDLGDFINEADMTFWFGFEPKEVHMLMNMYESHLKRLRKNEGVDFWAADQSLRNCIRLASFFLFYMFDWYSFPCHVKLSPHIFGVLTT